jgi:glycosyltransferase involved in cell wall biosynthesis
MGDYLHANGWRVIGIGIAGARSSPPAWQIFEAGAAPERNRPRFRTILRNFSARRGRLDRDEVRALSLLLRSGIIAFLGIVPMLLIAACAALVGIALLSIRPAWGARAFRSARNLLNPVATVDKLAGYGGLWLSARLPGNPADRELERQYPMLKAMRSLALQHGTRGIWVANDWLMLPLAAEGARTHGGAYVYDSHEFATQEFAQKWDWRFFRQPLVKRVEGRYIVGAGVVTTVSPQITQALVRTYNLTGAAATLRNMPVYQKVPYHPTGPGVRILYHGIVAPDRGLEVAIESLSRWPEGFSLTIRGPAHQGYAEGLSALAARYGVSHRLAIEAPLPMEELVSAASAYDVGLLALPGHSDHNAYALPNKIYEYLMAGLALCVSDLPAMADVVRATKAGVLCGDGGAEALADALRGLTRDGINEMKANALRFAKELHFETDAKPVMRLYLKLL